MVIQELDLTNFRNYAGSHIQFSPRLNWIHGENGQGKTNLAESLHYLCNLESFRTRKLVHLLQSGHAEAGLKASLLRGSVLRKVQIRITPHGRQVYLDHSSFQRVSEYILTFIALTFTPEDVGLFRNMPQERRRFFNRVQAVFDSGYFRLIQEYSQALTQKNALLKRKEADRVDVWNRLLGRYSIRLVQHRRAFVEKVNTTLSSQYQEISGRDETLALRYHPSLAGREENEESYAAELDKLLERELRAGHSISGPHRDDFQLMLDDKPDRNFFSQGEFRITNLSLKMTLNQLFCKSYQFHPVLIFDDLFSELDERMSKRIVNYFLGLENQIFITSTTPPIHEISGKAFRVSQGKLV